jgi:hypothetical protein
MRINEILTESQLQQLDEGPIGSALGAVGRGIGKVAGGVAKGIGAVAGGVVGAGRAMKKGYQSGKAFVGDDPDPNKGQPGYDGSAAAPASGGAPAAGAAPAAGGGGAATAAPASGGAPAAGAAPAPAAGGGAPSAQDINAAGPKGTAPATAQTGAAGQALAKTTAAVDQQTTAKAGQTVYAQVKANVDKLDKKGKQRILQLLQKSMATPDPKPAAGAAGAPAAPAAEPTTAAGAAAPKKNLGFGFNTDTGEPFSSAEERTAAGEAGKMAAKEFPAAAPAPANTMANAPVSATNTAAADNPNQPPPKKTGGKVAGQVSQTPGAIAKREKRQAAASAKSTGNKVFGQMANTLQQQNASKNNYGNALSEALALRVEAHKQKMFETGLSQGTISVFRK